MMQISWLFSQNVARDLWPTWLHSTVTPLWPTWTHADSTCLHSVSTLTHSDLTWSKKCARSDLKSKCGQILYQQPKCCFNTSDSWSRQCRVRDFDFIKSKCGSRFLTHLPPLHSDSPLTSDPTLSLHSAPLCLHTESTPTQALGRGSHLTWSQNVVSRFLSSKSKCGSSSWLLEVKVVGSICLKCGSRFRLHEVKMAQYLLGVLEVKNDAQDFWPLKSKMWLEICDSTWIHSTVTPLWLHPDPRWLCLHSVSTWPTWLHGKKNAQEFPPWSQISFEILSHVNSSLGQFWLPQCQNVGFQDSPLSSQNVRLEISDSTFHPQDHCDLALDSTWLHFCSYSISTLNSLIDYMSMWLKNFDLKSKCGSRWSLLKSKCGSSLLTLKSNVGQDFWLFEVECGSRFVTSDSTYQWSTVPTLTPQLDSTLSSTLGSTLTPPDYTWSKKMWVRILTWSQMWVSRFCLHGAKCGSIILGLLEVSRGFRDFWLQCQNVALFEISDLPDFHS
jgi:hypothetical protein